MKLQPMFLAAALAVFVIASLLPDTAAAGEMSRVIELKSKSDDATRIVAKILDKESDRLDECGEKYMATKPKGPALVRLKIRLSPQEAQVSPVKSADAQRPEVGCVGRVLAGLAWPKPSGKIDVVADILLGRMKKAAKTEEVVDLDEVEDDDKAARAEERRKAEARAEERRKAEARAEERRKAEARAEEQRKAEARAEEQRKAEARAEEQRKAEARAEEERKAEERRKAEARAEERRKAEARAEEQRKAEARAEEQRKAEARAEDQRQAEAGAPKREEGTRESSAKKSGRKSVNWRSMRVGYIANSIEGEFGAKAASEAFDEVLPKIDKAWRGAMAFNAMVRVQVLVGSLGQVEKVEVLKSSDAADFEGDLLHIIEAMAFPGSGGGSSTTVDWTFAFKR